MKVIMLSTDKNIFKNGSPSQERMKDYGGLVEELHIIVKSQISNLKSQKLGNIFVYPTNDWAKLLYFFDAYKISSSIIRNFKLEIRNCVITCQDPFETGLVGYLIKRKFKLPLQIQVHTDFLSPYFWRESLKNKVRVLLAKQLIKKADGIRVVSNRIKESILRTTNYQLQANISVLPIVYDMERFSKAEINTDLHKKYPNHDFIILSASRLTKEKNIGLAIKAVKEAVKKRPKILLLIIGSGPEESKLKLLATNYELQTNVVFEPWTGDLPSYYKTADVFVLTSNYEGGARSPAEAMASGLPVIMTDVAPAGEMIIDGKNGFVVPVNDHRQLAGKLIELASDAGKRTMFKKQSLAMAVGFITKEIYLKLYYQALTNALTQNKNYE